MGGKSAKMLKFLDNAEDREALNNAFKAYDTDGNGTLDQTEFAKFAEDLVDYVIAKKPSTKCVDVIEDATSNQDVTLKKMNPATKERIVRILASTLFEVCDSDHSGEISVSEWETMNWGAMVKNLKGQVKKRKQELVEALKGTWKYEFGYGCSVDTWTGRITIKGEQEITGSFSGNIKIKPPTHVTSGGVSLCGDSDGEFPVGAKIRFLLDVLGTVNPSNDSYKIIGLGYFCLGNGMAEGMTDVKGTMTREL